ncbi:hypothetical protein GGR53DRAFT_391578 [Hypoxylon sp. FL1150]|nr:hypothetical protein GGR53DRAFT_391578 [Hypoxylon sp. FL1150]
MSICTSVGAWSSTMYTRPFRVLLALDFLACGLAQPRRYVLPVVKRGQEPYQRHTFGADSHQNVESARRQV